MVCVLGNFWVLTLENQPNIQSWSCSTEKRFGQVCDASARDERTQRKMEFTRLQISIVIGHGGLDIIKQIVYIYLMSIKCW